jgi:hypothetical protein
MQGSAAKYVEVVNQIGHEKLGCPFPGEGEAPARLRASHEARFISRPRRYPEWIHDLDCVSLRQ